MHFYHTLHTNIENQIIYSNLCISIAYRGESKINFSLLVRLPIPSADLEVQLVQLNHYDGVYSNYWNTLLKNLKLSPYISIYVKIRPWIPSYVCYFCTLFTLNYKGKVMTFTDWKLKRKGFWDCNSYKCK